MAAITFQPPVDVCSCTITVGGQASQQVPVHEISSLGAVVAFQGSVRRHEYADVAVFVQGKEVLSLFAHIVNVRSEVIHLRWLHLSPGESEALATQLVSIFADMEGVQRGEASGKDFAWRQEQGTRRIVRPRPGSKPESQPEDNPGTQRRSTRRVVRPRERKESDTDIDLHAVIDQELEQSQAKRGTRRIVRPRQQAAQAPHPAPSADEDPQRDRKARRVVKPQQSASQPSSKSSSRSMVVPQEKAAEAAHELSFDEEDEAQPSTSAAPVDDAGQALQRRETAEQGPSATDVSDVGDQEEPSKASPPAPPSASNWRERGQNAEDADDQLALVKTERLAKMSAKDESVSPSQGNEDLPAGVPRRDAASQKILSRARTVQASELAARHDKVRVLNMSTIKELIKESVAEAVVDMNTGMDMDRLAEEVERRVDEQLQAFKAEKDDVEARAQRLEAELKKAKEAVDREQKRAIEANQFTISDAGIADIERRLERLVAAAIRRNGVNDVLADELRSMVTHILDDERDKIADNARKAQAETINLLERKINRLSSSLDESQKDQQRAKRMLEVMQQSGGGGALRNVMTAGLDEDDPEAERKKDLMRDIMAQNRAIRDQMKQQGLQVPVRKSAPAVQDDDDQAANESPSEDPQASATSAENAVTQVPESLTDDHAPMDEAEDGGDIIDPDDMPWEGPPEDTEEDDRPIKRLEVSVKSAAAKAPPLQIRRREDDQATPEPDEHDRLATEIEDHDSRPAVDASPDIDPDDMPWEPPADDLASDDGGGAPIKRISASKNVEPPPLNRGS